MKPSVGRTVHYQSFGTPGGEFGSECRAAIITWVPEEDTTEEEWQQEMVHLCVLNPDGLYFDKKVLHKEEKLGGTWHWPERVE